MEETLDQIRYLDHQLQMNELNDAQQELVSNHRLAANLRRTVRMPAHVSSHAKAVAAVSPNPGSQAVSLMLQRCQQLKFEYGTSILSP